MSCRGLHLAITNEDVAIIRARTGQARIDAVQALESALFGTEFAYETDKAWDPIHRCLGDGTLRDGRGEAPLNLVVLGGEILDPMRLGAVPMGYLFRLVTPVQAARVADALSAVTETSFRHRYFGPLLDGRDYSRDEIECEVAWAYLRGLPAFFARAAAANRHVLFCVDQ